MNLQAERSQKKGGMVKCATILVIMCFVMLVLLILKEIILWFFNMNLDYNLILFDATYTHARCWFTLVKEVKWRFKQLQIYWIPFLLFTSRRVLVMPYLFLYACIGGIYISSRTIVPGTCIERVITIIGFMVYLGHMICFCSLGNFVIFIWPPLIVFI